MTTTTVTLEEPQLTVIRTIIADSSAFFLKYKVDSMRLINSKALIDLGYKPKVSLFADAGYQSSFDITPYKNFGTNIGINFTIPIYDGRQRRLQYTRFNIEKERGKKIATFLRDNIINR